MPHDTLGLDCIPSITEEVAYAKITCNGNEHYYKNFTELKQTVFDTARNSKMKNFFKLFSVETEFFETPYADGILFAREQKQSERRRENARKQSAERNAGNAEIESIDEQRVKTDIQKETYYTRKHSVKALSLRP